MSYYIFDSNFTAVKVNYETAFIFLKIEGGDTCQTRTLILERTSNNLLTYLYFSIHFQFRIIIEDKDDCRFRENIGSLEEAIDVWKQERNIIELPDSDVRTILKWKDKFYFSIAQNNYIYAV